MSAPSCMPFYVGDYLADTGHLSRCEHGAYLLLIMHYWQNGGLPDDAKKLAQITRSESVEQWSSIATTMSALFQPGWRHKRIDMELAKARDRHEKRRNAGKIGGLTKASNASFLLEQKPSTDFQTPPISKGTNLDTSNGHVLFKEPTKLASTRDRPQVAGRATRIPADFRPDIDEAVELGMSRAAAEQEAASFCDYWIAKPTNATKLDWLATWRNWVRKAMKDSKGNGYGNSFGRPVAGSQESATRVAVQAVRNGYFRNNR